MSLCTRRSTRPTEPRWRMTLTRKRPRPDTEYAKSASRRRDELLGALLRHDRERDALGLDRRHRGVVGALEAAVDADERRRADLDVDVGRAALDGVAQAADRDPTPARHPLRLDWLRPHPLSDRHRPALASSRSAGRAPAGASRRGIPRRSSGPAACRSRAACDDGPARARPRWPARAATGRPSRVETVAATESRSASRS